MRQGLLERHLAVLHSVASDAFPDLFGLRVVASHSFPTQIRTHALHLHENAAVLTLGLDDPALGDGGGEGRRRPFLGSVGSERLHLLQLHQELEVGLRDLVVSGVELVREGPTFDILEGGEVDTLARLELLPSLSADVL